MDNLLPLPVAGLKDKLSYKPAQTQVQKHSWGGEESSEGMAWEV